MGSDKTRGENVSDSAEAMPLRRIDPATLRFHIGDAVAKLIDELDITQKELGDRIGKRGNTISDFIRQRSNTEPETVAAILGQLQVTKDEIDTLVDRMNGVGGKADRTRDHNERAEDRDPRLRDAREHGERIAALPEVAQYALFHLIRAFESATRRR